MSDTSQILVVVPAYNAEAFVERTLQSVLAQSVGSWDCVVSDDGSTDSTREIALKYTHEDARIHLLSSENGGVSLARNRGAQALPNAPYVLFLDADDLLAPDALQVLHTTLEAHPAYVAAHGYADKIDATDQWTGDGSFEYVFRHRHMLTGKRVVRSTEKDMTTFAMLAVNNAVISPGAMLIRRQAFNQVGGFNPLFSGCADWEFWARLSLLSDLYYTDVLVMHYRSFGASMSSNHRKMAREVQRTRHAIIEMAAGDPTNLAHAKSAYRAFYQELAVGRLRAALDLKQSGGLTARFRLIQLGLANAALSLYGHPPRFLM